jgi:hypothetical protein
MLAAIPIPIHSSKEEPCNSMQPIMDRRHTESLDTKPMIRSDFKLPLFTPHLFHSSDWNHSFEAIQGHFANIHVQEM